MKEVIILIGMQGSGKSYYANEIKDKTEKMGRKFYHLNRDKVRVELIEKEYNIPNMFDDVNKNLWDYYQFDKHEDMANELYQLECENILKIDDGVVVVDNMNLSPKKVRGLINNFKNHGFDVKTQYFDVSFDEAICRNENRQHKLNINVINDTYITFNVNYRNFLDSKCNKQNAVIFDIDGTLAHNNHNRSPYETGESLLYDDPDYIVGELLRYYYNSNDDVAYKRKVIVLSGRKSHGYKYTKKWLEINNLPHDLLLMRRGWDNRKDCDIKREIYENCIIPFYNVDVVFDDRPQVVNMWNDMGLKTFACADQRIVF